MDSYILIVDDEEDILEIHEMTVRSTFSGEVRTATSGQAALRVIQENGTPLVIISDYQMPEGDGLFLLKSLVERSIQIPFIVCSGNPLMDLKANFPNVYIITKPNIVNPMTELLEVILKEKSPPKFVPVAISQLLKIGYTDYDFFVKLSEKNFIKVLNKGESFTAADGDRFTKKGIHKLFISHEDALNLIGHFDSYLQLKFQSIGSDAEDVKLAYEAIESVESLSRSLGWVPESVELAKRTVDFAIKAISAESEIFNLLRLKMNSQSDQYSHHVGTLALMTSAFCMQMGWTSEATQMKLAMAALLHDVTVDAKAYGNIEEWNDKAKNPKENSEEVLRYRNHPVDAVNLLYRMKNLPADIDNIILNHHENSSASGFPRKIIASRVSHLAAIFIIMEDLIHYVEGHEPSKELIEKFVEDYGPKYAVGRFKNIFSVLKESLRV